MSKTTPKAHTRKWRRRVRAWILRVRPSEGTFIGNFDKAITFEEVWARMKRGEEFHDICRCTESEEREMVFAELAELLGCAYEVVYDRWLHGAK